MKTLTSPVTTLAAASQQGWAELYDIYLPFAVALPWGTVSTIRITATPSNGGFGFFTPKITPEPSGTQGNAATYYHWPVSREIVKADATFSDDKLNVMLANAGLAYAGIFANVEQLYDVPIVIRKVPIGVDGLTADDCAVVWTGYIDSGKFTEAQLQFECSNDLANLQATAPRENMHTNCRFQYGDDMCTQLKYRTSNYKAGTVGVGSSATVIKSADFTEDTSAAGTYGTDLVNALADAAITASSDGFTLTNQAVTFKDDNGNGIFSVCYTGPTQLSVNDGVVFSGTTAPTGLSFGTTYYVRTKVLNGFTLSATPGGATLKPTSAGSSVKISTSQVYTASAVKSSKNGYWKLGNTSDWGTETAGFWQIPDAQAGLANSALTPWIQFDFGSAKTPRLWRISSVFGVRLEELVKTLVLFSSSSSTFASDVKHETYMYLPPRGGVLYEFQVPSASTKRYWRICVRARWAPALLYALIGKVYAYEDSRHYWGFGRITFAATTATSALQGVSRRVLESYNGQVLVPALPTAPAAGDAFTIQRGCARTFNACCARGNWENYGGFLDLPYQTVIR